jgi:acetylglutamate/LysW-gamma-L-alpha-aminoadipate kinase
MTLHVLKLGGGAGIEAGPAVRNLASRLRAGERWILVHGASAAANALAEQVGCPVQSITSPGGHVSRYTDARMIEFYSAAAASITQQLTAQLASLGVPAVGLAGPNIIAAQRKTAIRAIRNGRSVVVRDDYSGTITGINVDVLRPLLQAGLTPVIAPVAMGQDFERLNVDGDLAAATIARTFGATVLVILSNVPGLLRDVEDPGSLIRRFALRDLDAYEPLAEGRMKKKLLAARSAGVPTVILGDARPEHPLDAALAGAGTCIVGEHHEAPEVRHVEPAH